MHCSQEFGRPLARALHSGGALGDEIRKDVQFLSLSLGLLGLTSHNSTHLLPFRVWGQGWCMCRCWRGVASRWREEPAVGFERGSDLPGSMPSAHGYGIIWTWMLGVRVDCASRATPAVRSCMIRLYVCFRHLQSHLPRDLSRIQHFFPGALVSLPSGIDIRHPDSIVSFSKPAIALREPPA